MNVPKLSNIQLFFNVISVKQSAPLTKELCSSARLNLVCFFLFFSSVHLNETGILKHGLVILLLSCYARIADKCKREGR